MEDGKIVPVEITCSLLKEEMKENGWNEKYLFLIDGFPRNNDNFDGWMRAMSQETRLVATINLICERVKFDLLSKYY
jgi:UMP-CMP kinase